MNALTISTAFTHFWWDDAVTQAITIGRQTDIKHRVTQDRVTGAWQVGPVVRPPLTLVLGEPIPTPTFGFEFHMPPVLVPDPDIEGVARVCGVLVEEPCS